MAYSIKPSSNRIRRTGTAVRNDYADTNQKKEDLRRLMFMQLTIEKYNNLDIWEIDSFFKSVDVGGTDIIVRVKHENLIKTLETVGEETRVDAFFRQIDARERLTDKPQWVPTPFPYIEEAVVVAISSDAMIDMIDKKEKLAKEGITYRPLQVGDVIHIKADAMDFYRSKRFYIDKQKKCLDFLRNQTELRLSNFERYFRIDYKYDVEVVLHEDAQGRRGFFAEDRPAWWSEEKEKIEEKLKTYEDIVSSLNVDGSIDTTSDD